ncbi:MAG: neutral/alkaline non-lysosomal ceramidase N-terminal domain-containing protein [Planctomycetaceae bacterium]
MSTITITTAMGSCRLGLARCEITPPVGIYHRMWGAAVTDRATGVHRPLTASALVIEPLADAEGSASERFLLIALDHCLFRPPEMEEILDAISRLTGMARERIVFAFSHTHSAGLLVRDRKDFPGGDLIGPYLDALPEKLAECYRNALATVEPVNMTAGSAPCAMGQNRDYWDEEREMYVCGFNPDRPFELDVQVLRVTRQNGEPCCTLLTYPCHPTTLAWQNSLISPDYIGAAREVVERETGVPCVFLLSTCGDIGPRDGYVGDTEVADRNGRQVGHAAIAALLSLPPPNTEFVYAGPVISGATLGTWKFADVSPARRAMVESFEFRPVSMEFPLRHDLPGLKEAEAELQKLLALEPADRTSVEFRDWRAKVERQRRLKERVRPLGDSRKLAVQVWACRIGEIGMFAVNGEPYYAIYEELKRRHPQQTLWLIVLANGAVASYLPRREDYEKSLYQADIAVLERGSLEQLTDDLSEIMGEWSTV